MVSTQLSDEDFARRLQSEEYETGIQLLEELTLDDERKYPPITPDFDTSNDDTLIEYLDHRNKEFQNIADQMEKENLRVIKITKYLNKKLWSKFTRQEESFRKKYPSSFDLRPVLLFHSPLSDPERIFDEGLNSYLANTGDFGRGLYFSANPSYCAKLRKGRKVLILCRVLLGKWRTVYRGNISGNFRTDSLRGTIHSNQRSNDVVVITNVNQIYPEFLIEYSDSQIQTNHFQSSHSSSSLTDSPFVSSPPKANSSSSPSSPSFSSSSSSTSTTSTSNRASYKYPESEINLIKEVCGIENDQLIDELLVEHKGDTGAVIETLLRSGSSSSHTPPPSSSSSYGDFSFSSSSSFYNLIPSYSPTPSSYRNTFSTSTYSDPDINGDEDFLYENYLPEDPPPRFTSSLKKKHWQSALPIEDQCSICLKPLDDGPCVMLNKCSHYFHEICISPWAQDKEEWKCPYCKQVYKN